MGWKDSVNSSMEDYGETVMVKRGMEVVVAFCILNM